ncbi:MAG: hypothetical protein ACYTG5_00965 [Planctomycetota bacterium]|jgi:hypothetical protein
MKPVLKLALIPLLSLAIGHELKADEFHFGSAEAAAKMAEGSNPDMVRGVLLRREGNMLVIRIVGGEISVPRSSVYKIVNDDLSVADIVDFEMASAQQLAESNHARLMRQADEAAERLGRIRDARAREAELDAARAESYEEVEVTAPSTFDPIIGIDTGSADDFATSLAMQKELGGYIRRHIQRSMRSLRRWYR